MRDKRVGAYLRSLPPQSVEEAWGDHTIVYSQNMTEYGVGAKALMHAMGRL